MHALSANLAFKHNASDFVIVVDTQRDFMTAEGALHIPGADALIKPISRWLATLDVAVTAGVLFTFDSHSPEVYRTSAEARFFPVHCVRGTPGWSNLFDPALIHPAIPVWRLEKNVFNMWAEPHCLIEQVRQPETAAICRDEFFAQLYAHGIHNITLAGVAADYCVRWAIEGCVARGFNVTVPAAFTCGIDRQITQVAAQDFSGKRLSVI